MDSDYRKNGEGRQRKKKTGLGWVGHMDLSFWVEMRDYKGFK